MGTHDRDTDASCGHFDVGVIPDLASLLHHLHLLLVVSIFHHVGVVGEQVECVLASEDVGGERLAIDNLLGLLLQLCHSSGSSTRGGLVGGDHHAVHTHSLVEGSGSHQADDGGAVGVGNNATSAGLHPSHCLWVNFGDHQRDTFGHPEGTAVVDNHCALLRSDWSEFLADGAASREERDVHAVPAVLCEFFNSVGLTVEVNLLSCRPSAGKHLHLAVREVALDKHLQEFLTNSTGHSSDCNDGTIWSLSSLCGEAHTLGTSRDGCRASELHLVSSETAPLGQACSLAHL
mmetsp:Transcript_24192/g.29338  ORF Transcript_24192/g.29338 Transcript_24192/m.29338 type:complete len:290 (+) Transcript_24192:684-1553(+)